MIIIGLFSIIIDYILLNISTFRLLFFPMFTIVFLFSSFVIKYDFKITIIVAIIYSILSGIIFPLITILIVNYYFINKKDYYLNITISLILYDSLLYLLTTPSIINNLYLLVSKFFITIPINLLYSYVLLVLNRKYININ